MAQSNKKITQITQNGIKYTLLGLPKSNVFKFEVVQKFGALIEKDVNKYFPSINKEVYGISHLIEHMSFKHSKKYDSDTILSILKKYGKYNASTNYDRVNYWYQTTMDHMDTAIDIISEIAWNNLQNVPNKEFELERDTVYNECKRYMDDDHTSFHLTSTTQTLGIKPNDNVLGSLENISSLKLEDVITVKELYNMEGEQVINIVFDNSLLTPQEVVNKISNFIVENVTFSKRDEELVNFYKENLPKIKEGNYTTECNAEQKLYSHTFQLKGFDTISVSYAANFLSSFSKNSLFDEVREKRGLTYGISLGKDRIAYTNYWNIYCDITAGNEEELIKAIKIASKETLNNFSEEDYKDYITTQKINRDLGNLNLTSYGRYIWLFNEEPLFRDESNELTQLITSDIDKFLNKLDEVVTFDKVKEILTNMDNIIQNDIGAVCWSKPTC